MIRNKLAIQLVLVFLSVCMKTNAYDKNCNVVSITTNEGLSNNTIRDICQDSQGYMWFCTPNGLNRYDGISIQKYWQGDGPGMLTDSRIRRISEDANKHLWISTMSDVFSCYDMNRKKFVDISDDGRCSVKFNKIIHIDDETWLYGGFTDGVRISFAKEKAQVTPLSEYCEFLASKYINFIKKCDKYIWLGTEKGLFRWNGKGMSCVDTKGNYIAHLADGKKNFFLTNDCNVHVVNANGKCKSTGHGKKDIGSIYGAVKHRNLWIIYGSSGCMAFDITCGKFADVPQELNVDETRRLMSDNKGGAWVTDAKYRLLYIGEQPGMVRRFDIIPSSMMTQNYECSSVFHGMNNTIWISTTGNGLFKYNTQTDELKHYTSSADSEIQIPTEYLKYVYEDRSGSLWLGSALIGVVHIQFVNSSKAKYYNLPSENGGFCNQIRFVNKTKGDNLIIGNRNGDIYSAKIQNNELADLSLISHYNSIAYNAELDKEGALWVATKGGGLYVDGKAYTSSTTQGTSLSSNNCTDLLRDSNGRMWIATFGGGLNVAIGKDRSGYVFKKFFDNADDRNIRMMCEDHNGWIWMATSNGVIIFEPDHLIADPNSFTRLSMSNGKLLTNEIRTIFCDHSGQMWISETGYGIATCMPTGNYGSLYTEHYTAADGIVMTMIQSFEEDARGNIWISTENGLLRFDTKTKTATSHYFSYDLPKYSFCENSSEAINNKFLLFGSNNGLLLINADDFHDESVQSRVYLSGIKLNGVEYSGEEIVIPYDFESLDLSFSNFDYSSAIPPLYMYMVEGRDTTWSTPEPNNTLTLSHIKHGKYMLHIKAFTTENGWSEELVIPIVVERTIWMRWWAIIIYLIVIGMASYLVRRQYLSHKTLVHDYETMETKIAGVQKMFVDEIKSNPCDGENSDKQFLEKIEKIVKQEMANADFTSEDFANMMNMSHTTFYNTVNRIIGKSPKEYIRHYRMKEAARLLVTSNNNVSQIAFMVGYNDVSYFSKNFKKHFGVSPLKYKSEYSK